MFSSTEHKVLKVSYCDHDMHRLSLTISLLTLFRQHYVSNSHEHLSEYTSSSNVSQVQQLGHVRFKTLVTLSNWRNFLLTLLISAGISFNLSMLKLCMHNCIDVIIKAKLECRTGKKLGQWTKLKQNIYVCWNYVRMCVLMISRISLNIGHVLSKTRSLGQMNVRQEF